MFYNSILRACLCIGVVLGVSVQASADITLVENHQALSVIVVSPQATTAEAHAASELSSFLSQVTGASIAVINAGSAGALPNGTCICVGIDAARYVDPSCAIDDLGADGIIIHTIGDDVVLAGGRPRGTLNAVFTFLEDYVGCRWWTPWASTIPTTSTLTIPNINIRYRPQIEQREVCTGYVWTEPAFLARNKLHQVNPWAEAQDPQWAYRIVSYRHGHTFSEFIGDEYFDEHPEWFSLVDGQRVPAKSGKAQLCLTNEEMRQQFVTNVRTQLNALANIQDLRYVWISQNDWAGYCECDKCRQFNLRQRSESGTIIDFVNHVAEELEDEFPNLEFWTLAYDYSQAPPRSVKPRDNVLVWLATTETDHGRPLGSDANRTFHKRLQRWAARTDRLIVWDYLTSFSHYFQPYPNLRTLGDNVRLFAANHVTGIRGQHTEFEASRGVEMMDLRVWVLSKLYWNPQLDADTLIDEFLHGFYGQTSGTHIKSYLDVIHDSFSHSSSKLDMYDSPFAGYLDLNTLVSGWGHLANAFQNAANPDVQLRVQIVQMGIMYTVLVRWDELREKAAANDDIDWPFGTYDSLYAQFNDIMTRGQVTHHSISNARGFMSAIKRRVGLPEIPRPAVVGDLPRHRWVDIPPTGIELEWGTLDKNRTQTHPSTPDDALAAYGKAAQVPAMSGDQKPWLSLWFWQEPLVSITKGINVRCLVSLRATTPDTTEDSTPIVQLRIRPTSQVGHLFEKVVTAGELDDDTYTLIDLGLIDDISGWTYLHINMLAEQATAGDVFIDRIILIYEGPQDCDQVKELGYGLPGDLNSDCHVGWSDFGIFATQWQMCNNPEDMYCIS